MALEVKLSRSDHTPWGFRLVGGTDFEYPITVSKVLESSLAEHSGLLDGDVIIEVNERPTSRLTHEGAHDVIMQAGNQCVLRVVRADEYRNPTNADPADYEPAPAIIQGFTPITTPLGHEVPDHRTRLCESPFTLATKPYRPFSTEPIIGIPPLEEPIILDPKYQDDFTKIQLKDFEPDTIFKLKRANEKYTNCNSNFSEITQNTFSEENSIKFSQIVQNGFYENVKNIEETARCLVNENLAKASKVSEGMKREIDFEHQRKNHQNFEINDNISNEAIVKNNISAEKNVINCNAKISKESSEIHSGVCKQEQKVSTSTKIAHKSIETKIDKHELSENTERIHISQLESSQDSKSELRQVSQSESDKYFHPSSINRSDEKYPQAMKSGKKTIAKCELNNLKKKNENEIFFTNVQCQESKIEDIQKSLKHTSVAGSSTEQNNQASESTKKTTELNKNQAHTTAKLLRESAILRSQTIPGLQGTIYSTHQYDLLLKTFFIHLTDVMVALSRLLMTDQSLSRSVSPMPPPKKELVTQKNVIEEQNKASGHQSRLSQFRNQSQKVVCAEVKCKVSEKSELDAKIDEILGQRDPLEWLAEIDKLNCNGLKTMAGSEESNNLEGVIMWEGHAHLISQEDLRESMDLEIKESATSDVTKNTMSIEEFNLEKTSQNQVSESLSQETKVKMEDFSKVIVKQPNMVEISEEILNHITVANDTKINDVQFSDELSEINESKIEDMQICDKISEPKKTNVPAVDSFIEISKIKENKIEEVQNFSEISETKETNVQAVCIFEENSEIEKNDIEDIQICKKKSEFFETKVEDVQIFNENSKLSEAKHESIKISDQLKKQKESEIEAVKICEEIIEINKTDFKSGQISSEIFEMNENKIKEEVEVSETKIEEAIIEQSFAELQQKAKHESIKISDQLTEQKESEIEAVKICDEIIEINETDLKSGQICSEIFEINKNIIQEKIEVFSEVSETKIEEAIIKQSFTELQQDQVSSFSQKAEKVEVSEKMLSEKEQRLISQRTLAEMNNGVSTVTEIKHKDIEATVPEDNQVRKQSESAIKAETDQYIPAPQTPLTDEYIFRLNIKLVESRSPSKSPARVTKKPPKPKPETQHEDPHIVKKPKLKASIETQIETLHSLTNNTDDPTIESTQCTKDNLGTGLNSTLKTPLSNADAASMATNSNTRAVLCNEPALNTKIDMTSKTPLTLQTHSTIDNAVSTGLSTEAASIIDTILNTNTINLNSNTASKSETVLSSANNLTTENALSISQKHEKAQVDEDVEVVEQKFSNVTNFSSETKSNAEHTSLNPTNVCTGSTLSTLLNLETHSNIDTTVSTGSTSIITEPTSSVATNLSSETASSTNIASSTASTCTSQQHENAQIAEDIGIVEQQLPRKESRKQSLPHCCTANEDVESPVEGIQNNTEIEEKCLEIDKSIFCDKKDTDDTGLEEIMGNKKEIVIVDQAVFENEDDIGKPGLTDEQIATLMSGESEVLKGQHIIGLTKVLASHMSRELDEDDDSSINFKKMKPQIEALKDSEVLKILNEELLKTKEERKYTTFLQRPNRPIPLGGNLWYNQPPPHEKYKVKIVKQPKPRVAPDAPKNFETGLLPWEERKLNEPPPPPIEREDPILVPEEGPEYLEALDNLPESAVPDLEDTGLPPPPEPVPREEDYSEKTEDIEFNTEGDTGDELEDFREAQTEEEKVEMKQNKMAMNVLCNIEDTVDPNMSVEEQLAVMHSQLLALSQLPAAIQHTLEAVTQQLSKIVPQANNKCQTEEQSASKTEQIDANIDQGETTESESHPIEEATVQGQAFDESLNVTQPIPKPEEEAVQEEKMAPEKLSIVKKEQEFEKDQDRTIDQSKRELIAELELEHQQRQVKQRPTARVGRPKPAFGPLVPQERPMILPGGRKWRRPKDAYNDDFIAETLTAQAEILQGKAKGFPYESVRLPYDQRINFMKYEKPEKSLDHLKDSSVYKLVHETDVPARGLEVRPAMVLAESEFRERCRSVTPVNTERPQVQEEHLDIPQQLQP